MNDKQSQGIGKGTPGPGRKAGIPNRSTTAFRETVTMLLEDNAKNVSTWLAQGAADDPYKALDLLNRLAEYATPKLSRAEHVGKGGGDIGLTMTVTHVKPLSIDFGKGGAS